MACTCNTSCSAALSQPPSQNLPTSGLGKPVCHSARLLGCNSAPPAGPSAAGPMATASPTTAASEQPSETAAAELLVTLASEARPCLELLFLGGNEEELLFLGGEGEEPTFLDSEEEEERQVVEMEVRELEEKEVSETVEEPAARHARVMTEEHELEYRALLEASETLPPTANEFNPCNARMEAYNKLLALRLTSDAPGAATCHGIGHWARDCPSRRVDPLSSRPMGPKVMVTTADPFEEATDSGDGHTGSTEMGDPEAMDLSSYQQPMDPDHEEEHNDDDDKGNVSGVMH
ncbi:hypothetical protein NDA15_003946 [Ustilago hordei]|nr:hypothetical protein NDA15_003946 [Ustilago hordei]